MTDETGPVVFSVRAEGNDNIWHVAESRGVRTPDGEVHSGLLDAIRYWFTGNPEDRTRGFKLVEE